MKQFALNTTLMAGLILLSQTAIAESCYKVNIKKKIDLKTCDAVPVILTVHDCADEKNSVDEKTLQATVDCAANPVRLKINYNGQTLISKIEPAQMWGGVNFRVTGTSAIGSASAKSDDAPAAKVAAVPEAKVAAAPDVEIAKAAKRAESKAAKRAEIKAAKRAEIKAAKRAEKEIAKRTEKLREPASTRPPIPLDQARTALPEKQVQEHADAVAKEAKIKDASTGEVAPAIPAGRLVETPSDKSPDAPKILKEDTKTEAPVPLNVKFSGFAWVETEDSRNFGYNGKSGIRNFDASLAGSQQAFSSFFSNLQMDISKDKTDFTTVFEIGEIINGEATTGGAQGGRVNMMEVRKAYLTHELNPSWSFKAGLLPLSSDPNGFIVADNFSGAVAQYKSDGLSASLWSAKAFENKPGTVPGVTAGVTGIADQYWGLSAQPKLSDNSKLTAYWVLRRNAESLVDANTATKRDGVSQYSWYGGTYDLTVNDHLSIQGTGIYNDTKFSSVDGLTDAARGTLFDAKVVASWKPAGFELLFEGLTTSGASDSVDATQSASIAGKRKGFNSPDPGGAYLFTIATSDGGDDAPGAPKESYIGNLSQPEGLQIVLVKASQTFNDKWSGFVRVGKLQSTAASAVTGSRDMGDEFDLNATYELAPGTTLQLDYGYLKPGGFFEQKDVAQLLTTRLKFSF